MSSAAPVICDACRAPIAMPGTFVTLADKHYHQGCGVGAYARRIEELEGRLRIWRDNYAGDGDMTITIPRYQLVALIGEKPANT